MSIYRYLRPVNSLPQPNGPLSPEQQLAIAKYAALQGNQAAVRLS